ncbi:MAG TPA: hypothetical protein DD734_01235, partial [Firmicutes bacterium]|nr:hypothetical protein [Bacillota bacterium]
MIGNLITLSRVILTFIVNYYILFHFGKVGISLLRTYLALYNFQIMPLWFSGVVFGKFVEFVFTSIILSKS